jgi:hypothetical protein
MAVAEAVEPMAMVRVIGGVAVQDDALRQAASPGLITLYLSQPL